jgi:hypothetical protein
MVGNVILPFQNIPMYRYIGILYQYTGIITHKLYRGHSPNLGAYRSDRLGTALEFPRVGQVV